MENPENVPPKSIIKNFLFLKFERDYMRGFAFGLPLESLEIFTRAGQVINKSLREVYGATNIFWISRSKHTPEEILPEIFFKIRKY